MPADAADRIRRLSDAVLTGAIRFDPTSAFAQLVERLVTFARLIYGMAAWAAIRSLGEPDTPLVDGNEFSGSEVSDRSALSWRPWRSYVALIHRTVPDVVTSVRVVSA
jgi:hypothetical protein